MSCVEGAADEAEMIEVTTFVDDAATVVVLGARTADETEDAMDDDSDA